MVVRKNISLEPAYLKKLEPLTQKHSGNLSAAIRDAIDITEASLRRYGTLQEAISKISAEKKELTSREESIESGRNVLLSKPIFLWMLRWTKGIPLEKEIFDELLDPLKIITLSELDKKINEQIQNNRMQQDKNRIGTIASYDKNTNTATVILESQYSDMIGNLVSNVTCPMAYRNADCRSRTRR